MLPISASAGVSTRRLLDGKQQAVRDRSDSKCIDETPLAKPGNLRHAYDSTDNKAHMPLNVQGGAVLHTDPGYAFSNGVYNRIPSHDRRCMGELVPVSLKQATLACCDHAAALVAATGVTQVETATRGWKEARR